MLLEEQRENQKRRLYVITSYRDLIGFTFHREIDHFISYSFLSKYCYKFICSRFYRVGRPEENPFTFILFFLIREQRRVVITHVRSKKYTTKSELMGHSFRLSKKNTIDTMSTYY